jgi:UDP-N-acetylglucosamine diphosphorylase / glucose-1-phosphate thymidylyltransferase / UDP-N-acetylgalactosamine diphosphorylase / glucosamine-1-phosphate N-acetyltransferase / galactosamine-1-phosphate N-acetyltransferase
VVNKAVILAAGKGKRMGDLTAQIPKPMLPLAGKPMLEHILDRLTEAGIRQYLIVIGYYGDHIKEHFAGSDFDITYQEQTVINGTAKAALLARDFSGPDPFLLTFGDILCEPADYLGLTARLTGDVAAVLGVKYVDDPHQGAAVYETEGRVTRIIEKPEKGSSTTNWNSAGLYAFAPAIFEELARVPLSTRGEYELTTAIETWVNTGRHVEMYAIQGDWMDVGRPQDLAKAENLVDSLNEP